MILLTGASGFVGRHVLSNLVKKFNSSNIYVLINKNNSPCIDFQHENLKYIRVGIEFISEIDIKRYKIRTIIHLASKNRDFDNSGFYNINVKGTSNIIQLAYRLKVQNIIYLSSTGVYGHQEMFQVFEDYPKKPDSEFSKSKFMAESIIKNSNIRTLILRHRFIIGEGDKFVIPGFIGALSKLPISINNNKAICSFVGVDDLAKVIVYFCKEGLSYQHELHQEFHITNGEEIQLAELYVILSKKLKIKHKIYLNVSGKLLYNLLLLYEKILKINPETNNGLTSLRVKYLGFNNHISNENLLSVIPGLTFQKVDEIIEKNKNYYSKYC
ncbi:NAD-dependent epimerase/dehydratase family protein [Zobellia nedashkovskayae]|uniref:NAD-dependent epimerase/dehydratase family protein n=1 Tax=Zobellia nedashkovskayae TaxID=2779510 RepID=UPI00188D4104|nr:NAD(P)-dependent oxidoreductase [Zobellia nedashkovskayae]